MNNVVFKKLVIFSPERSNLGVTENFKRVKLIRSMLKSLDIKYHNCIGMYKGDSEISFMVILDNVATLEVIKGICFKNFNQESILYQNSEGDAFLIYNNDKKELLGKLRYIPRELARQLDNYTILNEKYYGII